MIKNIELKKQNEINDIKAFRTLIQKCFETLDIHDNVTYQNYTPSKSSKNKLCSAELSQDEDNHVFRNKKSRISSEICYKDKKEILNQIRNILYDINSNFTLVFKKQYNKKTDNNKLNKEINNQPASSIKDDIGNEIIEKIQSEKFYKLCEKSENKGIYQNIPDEESSKMHIDECNFENIKEADKNEAPVAEDENKDISINSEDKQDDIISENFYSEAEIKDSKNLNKNELNNNKLSLCEEIEFNNINLGGPNENKQNDIITINKEINGTKDKLENDNFKINKLEENSYMNTLEFFKNKNENNETINYQKEFSSQNIDMTIENEEKKKIESLDNLESTSCEKSKILINSCSKKKISCNIFNNEKDQFLEKIPKTKENKTAKDYNLILVPNKNFINKNSRNRLTYNDSLNPNLFPWYYIKYSNFSPYDIVSIYKNFIKNEEIYNKSILKINYPVSTINPGNVYLEPYTYNKKGNNMKLNPKINNNGIFCQDNNIEYAHPLPEKTSLVNNEILTNSIIHESTRIENIYCYCKNPGGNELLMIGKKYFIFNIKNNYFNFYYLGCENEENCPNNGWIHKDCDEDLAKLSKDVIEKEDFKFLCKDCKNISSKTKKEKKSYKKK